MIDCFASWQHYLPHLLPVWRALPDEVRGTFFVSFPAEGFRLGRPDGRSTNPVLVAGISDHYLVHPRPTIMVNHGVGQTYNGAGDGRGGDAYSGGPGRERVVLHLEPGPLAARASADGGLPYEVVGSPMMDSVGPRSSDAAIVAMSFHHTVPQACPEQRSALPHYEAVLSEIAQRFYLFGHGHPRSWPKAHKLWTELRVNPVPDFSRVLQMASVYVVDNSSSAAQAAAMGIPVILLSAPWFRRDVEHDGRFWQWPRHMVHVSEPDDLAETIDRVLSDPATYVEQQRPVVEDCYVAVDGRASLRASEAILRVLGPT